ncbi:hypothetical protein ACJX0J_025723, partial [Zea mays]
HALTDISIKCLPVIYDINGTLTYTCLDLFVTRYIYKVAVQIFAIILIIYMWVSLQNNHTFLLIQIAKHSAETHVIIRFLPHLLTQLNMYSTKTVATRWVGIGCTICQATTDPLFMYRFIKQTGIYC